MFCAHQDGHHKLAFARLAIHGMIDGFSRKVLYLWCSNNNSAHTVLDLFYDSALVHGLPEKLYTDFGGENNGAGRFQVAIRNHGRRGNQRATSVLNAFGVTCRQNALPIFAFCLHDSSMKTISIVAMFPSISLLFTIYLFLLSMRICVSAAMRGTIIRCGHATT